MRRTGGGAPSGKRNRGKGGRALERSAGLLLVPAASRGFCREGEGREERSGPEEAKLRKGWWWRAPKKGFCVKALRCDGNGFTGGSVLYDDSARVNL